MSDKQKDLVMQIIREQLDEYLAAPLVDDICSGIDAGIFDNMELLEQLRED